MTLYRKHSALPELHALGEGSTCCSVATGPGMLLEAAAGSTQSQQSLKLLHNKKNLAATYPAPCVISSTAEVLDFHI